MSARITCEEENETLGVALTGPKNGTEGEKSEVAAEEKRKGDVGSGQDGADGNLMNTAQCPCYGQMYSTGSCAYR